MTSTNESQGAAVLAASFLSRAPTDSAPEWRIRVAERFDDLLIGLVQCRPSRLRYPGPEIDGIATSRARSDLSCGIREGT
jgi:hypothetical protein